MDDLQSLSDKQELRDLVARVVQAIDRADGQGIIACYADESFEDHGPFHGSALEFSAYVCDAVPTLPSPFLFHSLGQSLFDIDGDEAFGETTFTFAMQTSPTSLLQTIGRFVDYYQRIEGRWLVKYRRVVMEWGGLLPYEETSMEGHTMGRRDRGDPLYQRLTWPASV